MVPDIGELGPFAACTREQRARLRRLLTPIPVAAGEVLIECGAPPREFGVIADGEVVVSAPDGAELAVLGPGAIVGELALLRDVPTGRPGDDADAGRRLRRQPPRVPGDARGLPGDRLYVSHVALARLRAA